MRDCRYLMWTLVCLISTATMERTIVLPRKSCNGRARTGYLFAHGLEGLSGPGRRGPGSSKGHAEVHQETSMCRN